MPIVVTIVSAMGLSTASSLSTVVAGVEMALGLLKLSAVDDVEQPFVPTTQTIVMTRSVGSSLVCRSPLTPIFTTEPGARFIFQSAFPIRKVKLFAPVPL